MIFSYKIYENETVVKEGALRKLDRERLLRAFNGLGLAKNVILRKIGDYEYGRFNKAGEAVLIMRLQPVEEAGVERVCANCGKVFKGFYNQKICSDCASRSREEKKAGEGRKTSYKRKCHDCGKPTNNYRCESCWSKLRDPRWGEMVDVAYECGKSF